MAYMSQEKKKELAPKIKTVLKKYGMKGTIGVNNHSTLVVKIKEGKLDVFGNYNAKNLEDHPDGLDHYGMEITHASDCMNVNPYWLDSNYTGEVLEFLKELVTAMNDGNHDNSDIMTDYFDVGWYIDINIGLWNKPYKLL
jgi:hypothetical protein